MGTMVPSPFGEVEGRANIFADALVNIQEANEGASIDALFATLYRELHRLARRELARRLAPSTLSVTTLVHEAYLDMSKRAAASFPDEARFMGYVARVMRGLIIDHARGRSAIKRGGEFEITSLTSDFEKDPADLKELTEIGDALDELAEVEPELAELVDLKFFCGCSFSEIAALKNLSERTIQRRWEKARLYLCCSLRPGQGGTEDSCPH